MRAVASLLILLMLEAYAGLKPSHARTLMRGELVMAHEPCERPHASITETIVGGVGACTPPIRSDPQCGFGPNGGGAYRLRLNRGNLIFDVKLSGLERGCDGETLWLGASLRATGKACVPGPVECTFTDGDSVVVFPGRNCLVIRGRCEFGGEASFQDRAATAIDLSVSEIELYRGDVPTSRTFVAGVRIPPGKRPIRDAAGPQ